MDKNLGIQNLNSNTIDQSQVEVNQQEPRSKKDKSTPAKDWEIMNFLINLKSHEQDIIQLHSLVEKINTGIQILKTENQNLKLLLQDKKRKIKARQVKFSFKLKPQLPNLFQQKKPNNKPKKIEEEVQFQIKRYQPQTDKWKLKKNLSTIKILVQALIKTLLLLAKDGTSRRLY